MKRTFLILMTIVALGVTSQSCESSSNLEDIIIESKASTDSDAKEDEKTRPGTN